MPRPPNLQKSLDRLIAYLGAQIAKAVAERVGKSAARPPKTGVRPKRGKKASTGKGKGKGKAKGRKARSAGRARKKQKKCTIRGCNNPARSKGLCSKHYQRARYAALHGKNSGKTAKKGPARAAKKAAPAKPENA